MEAAPTLERSRERLLRRILSFISAAGEPIPDAIGQRKHLLEQAAELLLVGRHSETVLLSTSRGFPYLGTSLNMACSAYKSAGTVLWTLGMTTGPIARYPGASG
jgi:hypothetical protein